MLQKQTNKLNNDGGMQKDPGHNPTSKYMKNPSGRNYKEVHNALRTKRHLSPLEKLRNVSLTQYESTVVIYVAP